MGGRRAQVDARFVAAYLERVGLPARVASERPDLGALASLSEAHLHSVPFENLDIWRGVALSLELDALFDKVVRRRRGGFCYELNGLFASLLERLGYSVTRYSARVVGGDRVGPPFDHLALGARGADFAEQLIDVGFGEGPRRPMPLAAGAELDDVAGRWRLDESDDGELRLALVESRCKLEPGTGYLIDRTPRQLDEFAAMCLHHQTSEDSPFTRGARATLALSGGRITVTEESVVEWDASGRRTREVGDFAGELARIGISL